MPDPILDLILRRKSVKNKLSMPSSQTITMASPAFSYIDNADVDNTKFELNDLNNQIATLGFDPDAVESKIGDLPDNTPDFLVRDLLDIEDPVELQRKKAAIKWQAPIARLIENIADPAAKQKAKEEMSWVYNGIRGDEKSNYQSALSATKAAVDIIRKHGGDTEDMLKNLKFDSEYGLAKMMLVDPSAQKRWESLGLNPIQGIALDMKEIFEPNGAEYKKQVTSKVTEPTAISEQNFKKAELERYGTQILGGQIDFLLGKKASAVNKANAFYDENKDKLTELGNTIKNDTKLTEDMKVKLTGFQKEYNDAKNGKDRDVYISPYSFEYLKEKIDAKTASNYEIKAYNTMVGNMNRIVAKYKGAFDEYNQTAGEQNAAVREYNKIVNKIQESYQVMGDYNNLSGWAEYLAKQRNTLGERYPEYKQIELEGLVKDIAGDNVGLGEKTVFRLANSLGGEAVDGIRKAWNNLTIWDGDKLREVEMGDAYRRRVEDVMMGYETGDQLLKDERSIIPVVPKVVQDELNKIKNSNLSDEEKYQQNYQIISKAFDDKKIKYVANPKYGKYNFTSDAILNTISSVSTQFIGQMAMSYLSGGFGNVSKLRRLATLFGTTAAQTFSREYDAAVQRGDSNPFEQALTKSAIEGLSELPFDNIEFVKKLSPQMRKLAGDMTDAQWRAFRAGKIPSNLGREFVNAVESVVKEGALEEGLAQVGGNLADKYMFGKDRDITEGLDVAILAGTIGFAPLSIIGLPLKYRSANMGDKLMMYQAGFKADQVIDNLNQQVADGAITAEEAKQRIEAVKLMKEVVGGMSMYDVNGKPLTDNQKAQYAFNEYTKLKAKNIENLPEQQRQEVEQVVQEADQSSSNILNDIEDATNESERVMQGMPAEGNLQQPQGIGQGQQEEGQVQGAERQGEITQANVGYSDISGQEVDIEQAPEGLTEIAAKVVDDAFKAAKSLIKTGIKVRVFQNQADFERESAKLGQQARGQGVFVSDGKNILINLAKIKDVNDWGIVWHEGAHPVMNILRNSQPELYNKMAKGFTSMASQGGALGQVAKWAQGDYNEKSTDSQTDEAMVETISLIADGKIGLQDIPVSFRQQVIDFINTIADYLGLGQLADTSERVFAQKAAQIARAMTSGEDIATVVGEENVLRTENPFIGQEKKKGVQDTTPKPKDYKEKEAEVKALIEEQKRTPEAVLIEPQREKDGKLKLSVEFDEDGNRIVEVKFKQAAYDLKNGAKKYVNKDLEKAAEILSDKIAVDYRDNEARPEIAAGIGWYSKMRQRFQKYFGANIEMFGQLLAATSARTGVFDNFKQSVEAFRLYSQGKYNELLEDYDKYVKDIFSRSEEQLFKEWTADYPTKRPREFDADDYRTKLVNRYDKFPLKENGKKYNANSKKVLQALYGNWLQQTEGPKTKNFAGNLTGRSFGPTIDVWAARYLRRLIFQGNVDRWRIPPSLEKGVDYSILVSGEMSGDYPFAEKVMQMAADKLGINADDLQAFLWYLEKDVWDKNGWTNKSGAEKASFEQGADTLNTERYQAGVTTYKTADTFDPVKFEEERAALQKEIGSLPGVVAARITESIGEFYSEKDGIYVEPTFDVEFTMEAGSDVTPVRERVEKILKDYKQDATLFSKFVDASHPNARPIIEIGLASPVEKSQIIDDIKNILAQNNVRGFTLAKDTRGRIMGVRSQFVPEFEDGVKIKEGVDRFVKAAEIINAKYGKNPNISYIAASSVDTQVKFQNDGKEAQPNDGDSNAVGPVAQERRQSAARSLPGQQSEPGRDNQGRSGTTGRMGQKPGTGQQRRSGITDLNTALQERKSAARITSKAIDSLTDLVTKLGYGHLPEDVRERLKKKQRLIDADMNDMNVLSQRLEKAVKESYGVTYKKLDDETKGLLDQALRNFEGLTVRERAAAEAKIPDSILSIIDDMRATVDGMSLKLIEIGVLDDSLEPAFDSNKGLGVYLTRTYRKYDDPEWVKKVPEPVRQRAIEYLKANNFVREFDLAGNEIGERELTDAEIEGLVNYIATNMQPVNEGLQSANLGKTKVDILKGRKVIPEEIRDLMGEYKDPMVNFARSIAKMSSLIHTHQTLKAIAEANMGDLFFDRPTGDHYVPVAGEDKNYLQPLAGLYTTPEIAEAFKQVQSSLDGNDVNIRFLRILAGINGIVKIGKTALSPASWVRNVIGGHIIMLKDAHLFGNGYTDGWKNAIGYFANKSENSPEFQAKIREYIEQGILGDGVQAGEFKAIIKAAQKHEDPIEWLKEDSKLGKFVGGVKGFYSAQDDIFRVWAYENEKARLEKRKPDMSLPEVKAEASRKARATYPTYSELPEAIRQLAKFIPISSFPAFTAELIRTTKNSFKIAIEEIRDPDMRDVGVKRLAGVISAISFGSILSGLSAMLVGVSDDEEKAIRKYLPEWSKNSPLVWLGRDENGLPKYIDLGFSDPFSYFKKPVVALMNEDEPMADRIKNAVRELAAPFVSPEIFMSALMKGTKKLKETDDLEEVMGKYAGPVYEALEPGLIASLRRIGKGLMGDVDRYGQQYDPSLELLAFFSGQRIKKMDVPVSFSFKSKEFISSKRDIMSDYYTEKAKTTGDPEKQAEELADANEKLEKYFDNYKKEYDAAMTLMTRTMTAKTAKKILKQTMKDRNVPEDFIKAIERNKPYPTIEDDK